MFREFRGGSQGRLWRSQDPGVPLEDSGMFQGVSRVLQEITGVSTGSQGCFTWSQGVFFPSKPKKEKSTQHTRTQEPR